MRPTAFSILIVDDEVSTTDLCRDIALDAGFEVHTASTTEEALDMLERYSVDIAVTDLKVPRLGGLELLKRIRTQYPYIGVMMLTQYGTIETAVEATRLGALDYITKPFHVAEMRAKIDHLIRAISLDRENRVLREQLSTRPGFGGLIGVSATMQRVYRMIEKVSQHDYPVLILGESGTGKELVARSIHFAGRRKARPFVPVDCSGFAPALVESELFGHVKGAFTGAQHSRTGLLESATSGTVFLDEIGELPVDLQVKLLRALQEREVRPVGATDRVRIDVRIIAATNKDLEAAIRSGAFRQDLYFRLNVVQIKLPPLRERKSDIPLLVSAFLEKFGDPSKPVSTISEEAMRRLLAHDWPGNVRELENAIARAMAMGSGPILHSGDLPSNLHQVDEPLLPEDEDVTRLEDVERRLIQRVLRRTGGDKLAAARLLGIGKTTLYRKLKQYAGDSPAN